MLEGASRMSSCAWLVASGSRIDTSFICRRGVGGIGAALVPPATLTFERIDRAAARAAAKLGEPDISFRLACAPPAGFWGPQALAARAAPTVNAGIERVVRFCQQAAPFQVMSWQAGTCEW